jgi:outer membrane protein assembly factor BamB
MRHLLRHGLLAALLVLCALRALQATETENFNMQVLPAPGKVVIDGKFEDWDLTAGIFATSDAENLRDQYSMWFHVMYDAETLYLLARWKDPTPLNNPGVKGDFGFMGDCLQFRTVTTDAAGKEKTAHWDCWKYRDGGDTMGVAYGKMFNEGGIPNAKAQGAQQVFAVDADGKGYVQELAVPWSLLTADKQPLKTGARLLLTLEPNFTAGSLGRITMKDIFKPGVQIDRVFTFQGNGCWGYATLEKAGKLTPRAIRLSDGREFKTHMEQSPAAPLTGVPVVNWVGLIQSKALPGFKPLRFVMPFDGYVSLNLCAPDGTVARQLLTCAFFTKGEQEVKWDGLTTPYWRTPGQPVAPGAYTWKAIAHQGIGLRLRGWACNGGSAPWDSSRTTNWGGDHGVPHSCATDGDKVYLGWTGAEAGSALLACDLQGNVQWKHTHGGMGGAEVVAVDNGIVYVDKWGSMIYRLDAKTGTYSSWKGKDSETLPIGAIWEKPAGMPDRIEGMDARGGKVYISCTSAGFRRFDVRDMKAFCLRLAAGEGFHGAIFAKLNSNSQPKLQKFKADPTQDFEEVCKAPNYYTPDIRDDVVNVLNGLLRATTLVPNAAQLSAADLSLANRRFMEKALPEDLVPVRVGFLAVLDGATGAVQKLIDLEKPGFIRAVSDDLVYVVQDRRNVLAVNPLTGAIKTLLKGLDGVGGVTPDAQGRLYVSVQGKVQQVLVFTANGKPAGAIGRTGGRPALGAWVQDGVLNPAGLVVDKDGKLWVSEANQTPARFSLWQARATADKKEGAFLKEFFGPTHYGASGAAINPRDPNIMAGEGCEWRIDPKTGRDVCLGAFDTTVDSAALYAEGANGKLYLVTSKRDKGLAIRERLGDAKFALRGSIVPEGKTTVFWADVNGDEQQQPEELTTFPASLSMVGYLGWMLNMNGDLTLYANERQFKVADFTKCGAPRYDVAGARRIAPMGYGAVPTPDNRKLVTVDERYFSCFDTADGRLLWKYPNTFAGVHGSHKAPPPEVGLIRGAFGLVGNAMLPKPVGGIWAINGNIGEWHVLTEDGFYLTRLFQGDGFKTQWPDQAVPGAILDNAPSGSGGEDFGGSIRQGADGKVYVQSGKVALWNVEVTGLETIQAIPGGPVEMSADDVKTAQSFREKQLQVAEGNKKYTVRKATVAFSGNLDADFKGFTEAEKPAFEKQAGSRVRVAMAHDATILYVGWEVQDDSPWVNGADAPEFLYARGDTVDLQLGTNPAADAKRTEPVKGDLRLSIGNFQGQPTVVVYRKVADEKKPKIFSSGVIKEYPMDSVVVLAEAKVTVKVEGKRYVVEAALPLAALGLQLKDGLALRGDFGATHGDKSGKDTLLRTHWNNQATGLVNDEVFELKMEPANWGEFTFAQ